MVSSINDTLKGTLLHGKTSYYVIIVKIGPPVRPRASHDEEIKKKTLQWQTGYLPRPPTSSVQNQILHGVVFWGTVVSFKFHQNRLSSFRDVGGRNLLFPTVLATGLYNSLNYRTIRDID